LYIPPNTHQQASCSVTPSSKPSTRLSTASVESAPAAQNRAAACPSPLLSALTVAPEHLYSPLSCSAAAPASAPPPLQAILNAPTQKTDPFPQPFSVYLAKHQTPARAASSQTPLHQGHLQPLDEQSVTHGANAISFEVSQTGNLTPVQNSGLHKKFSVCSQEVFAINVDKPAPKFRTLSETLDSQILVSSLTPDPMQRPESPVPMEGSKTNIIQDRDFTTEHENLKQVNSTFEPDEKFKIVAEAAVSEAHHPVTELVCPPAERKHSVSSEIQSCSFAEIAGQTGITSIETEQVSSSSQSHTINITEQSVLSQKSLVGVSELKSSSEVTVETQSQFVSTLTSDSDRRDSPFPTATVPPQSQIISTSEQNICTQSQTVSSESASGFVPVSREQEYSASQFQQQTRQISSEQSSSVISESIHSLQTFADTQATGQPFTSPVQDHAAAKMSAVLSALTGVPASDLQTETEAVAPIQVQSAPVSSPAAIKHVTPALQPDSDRAPLNHEAAFPSPLLSALTVAPDHPYSPLPSATEAMVHVSLQSVPVSTQVVKPVAPAALPAGVKAPLARGAAYPSVMKAAPLQTSTQATLNPEAACPSPLISALTVAPDRPYSPLSIATSPSGFLPLQSPSVPVTEQLLRDGTQQPLLSAPLQKIPAVSKLEPVSAKVTPKRPVSSGLLPVIGAFRPIIPATEFKPIISEVVAGKESPFHPVSNEQKAEFAVSPASRPKTPIQGTATPTSRSQSGTPLQQQKYTTTGLQKPAIIPIYQQQMGEFPGQRPRSATPTCPMTVPRTQTPQPQLIRTEDLCGPQKPSASFQRQPPPQKLYTSYQPAAPAACMVPQPQTQPLIPFPNIPLPENFKAESLGTYLRPAAFSPAQPSPSSQQQQLSSTPLSAQQPEPPGPVFETLPLAAPQSTPSWSGPSVSALEPIVPKPLPVSATKPISVAKTPSAPSSSSVPNAGGGGVGALGGTQKGASFAGSTTPRRGRGVLTQQTSVVGARIPLCAHCHSQIRYFRWKQHCLFVLWL
jgi:hypothetical protein